MIRVLLADDHAVLRAGLRLLTAGQPDMTVVGESYDAASTLAATRSAVVDVAVVDLNMPGSEGVALVKDLTARGVRVVVLTMYDDGAIVDQSFRAGARGFVTKRAADAELLTAIRTASEGGQFVDSLSRRASAPSRRRAAADDGPRLSRREREVLTLLARGHTDREIAAALHIGVKSAETYKARLRDKLGLQTRADLVQYALRHGVPGADESR